MAYLDIWDIISERGFWEGDGSGEEVKGMLGFMVLDVLLAGAEELLRGPGGREPASKRETSLVLPAHCGLLPSDCSPIPSFRQQQPEEAAKRRAGAAQHPPDPEEAHADTLLQNSDGTSNSNCP